MGIGIGAGAFVVTSAIGGVGAAVLALDGNQRQDAFLQELAKRPAAAQAQRVNDGTPEAPRSPAGAHAPAAIAAGASLLVTTGLVTMMNRFHADSVTRVMAGVGGGLVVAGLVAAVVDSID